MDIYYDGAIVARRSDAIKDWWTVERRDHEGRVWWERTEYGSRLMDSARLSDADIEGTGDDFSQMCRAILDGLPYDAKRCAARPVGDRVELWSPRNSETRASVPRAVAEEFARGFLGDRSEWVPRGVARDA